MPTVQANTSCAVNSQGPSIIVQSDPGNFINYFKNFVTNAN